MSLRRLLATSFSPYEIAIMEMVLGYTLGIAVIAAIATGRIGGAAILLVGGFALVLAWREFSRCPECGKPPLSRARGEVGWLLTIMARGHLWPERRCSECGTALDRIA